MPILSEDFFQGVTPPGFSLATQTDDVIGIVLGYPLWIWEQRSLLGCEIRLVSGKRPAYPR